MPGLTVNPSSIGSVQNLVTSIGGAGGVSGAVDQVTSGAFGGLKTFFKTLSGTKLPLPNPLFAYASYDYVIGLGCLSAKEINNPDSTYIKGNTFKLICKSANADPNNRVKTSYGKFDFFIDNLQLKSLIGFLNTNSNVATLSFEITEPYSMGMFVISCQQLAQQLGYKNWREAPFVISLEFRGNKETGTIGSIPGTRRVIPFTFVDISMTADKDGAKYSCKGLIWAQSVMSDSVSKFKTDVSAQGKTVQEVLQTGENSIQSALNKKFKAIATAEGLEYPDEVIIYFPNQVASEGGTQPPSSKPEVATPIAAAPVAMGEINLKEKGAVFERLGVSRSDVNGTLVQEAGQTNAIGAASMNINEQVKGDTVMNKDNATYSVSAGIYLKSLNTTDSSLTTVSFGQNTRVEMAINNVIMKSNFATETLQEANLDKNGMRNWWIILPEQYFISNEINKKTGVPAKLHVWKILPYKAHSSKLMSGGLKPPGYENLDKEAVKVYNYMYTGKNVDILDFKIKLNFSFTTMLPSSPPSQNIDTSSNIQQGGTAEKQAPVNPLPPGENPDKNVLMPNIIKFVDNLTGTDLQGGGGPDTPATRAARMFHDALVKGDEMTVLRMKVIGDPYYITQSGSGNYTSTPTQYQNLNSDGTINWHNGEVDIRVNFRSPIDINQGTGLYNFGGSSKSSPVNSFTGLYQLVIVNSSFKGGQFTQELKALRRPMYESTKPAGKTFNANAGKVDAKDPYNTKDE
jgi:hypothetical protein